MRKPHPKRSIHTPHRPATPAAPLSRGMILASGAAAAFTFMGVIALFLLSDDAWKLAAVFSALGLLLAAICLLSPRAAQRRGFLFTVAAVAVIFLLAAFLMRGR